MEYTYPTDPLEFEKLLDEIITSNNYREYKYIMSHIIDKLNIDVNYYRFFNKLKSSSFYTKVAYEIYETAVTVSILTDCNIEICMEDIKNDQYLYYMYQYFLSIDENVNNISYYTNNTGVISVKFDDIEKYVYYTDSKNLYKIEGLEIIDYKEKVSYVCQSKSLKPQQTCLEPVYNYESFKLIPLMEDENDPYNPNYFSLDSFIRKFKISNMLSK